MVLFREKAIEGFSFIQSSSSFEPLKFTNLYFHLQCALTPTSKSLHLPFPWLHIVDNSLVRFHSDFLVKTLLVGDSGVGKTAIMKRFTDGTFEPTYMSTIGVDFAIRNLDIEGKRCKIQVYVPVSNF